MYPPHCWEDAGIGENNALSFKEMVQDVGTIWTWQAALKAFAVYLPWDWLPLAVVTSSLSYLFFSIINTGAKVWNQSLLRHCLPPLPASVLSSRFWTPEPFPLHSVPLGFPLISFH